MTNESVSAVKETGILMRGPLVIATLNDIKTMTRRMNGLEGVNERPDAWEHVSLGPLGHKAKKSVQGKFGATFMSYSGAIEENTVHICPQKCPYGGPGDRLWVRETHARSGCKTNCGHLGCHTIYRADKEKSLGAYGAVKWTPSIFMPRWASRLTLEITDVRVERLQDITRSDCIREGIRPWPDETCDEDGVTIYRTEKDMFRKLWQSINGPDSWDANPWVWVIEFKRVTP